MSRIEIQRMYRDDCTLGVLSFGKFQCFTLELPDEGNEPNISCIPEGTYNARVNISPTNGRVISIQDVPNRSYIQIHKGNYTRQIKGCILPGDSIKFLDEDSIPDVTNSRKTLGQLLKLVPEHFKISIYG